MRSTSEGFWARQPVEPLRPLPQQGGSMPAGPIGAALATDSTPLPAGLAWREVDLPTDALALQEAHLLLRDHYVQDDQSGFRLHYTADFLRWYASGPGCKPGWTLGIVDASGGGPFVAFILARRVRLVVQGACMDGAEVNFMCVHSRLRGQGLARLLMAEISRRVAADGVMQAVFTRAGAASISRPATGACGVYHRPLDVPRLVKTGFWQMGARLTLPRAVRLYGDRRALQAVAPAGHRWEDLATPHLDQLTERLNAFTSDHMDLSLRYSRDEAGHLFAADAAATGAPVRSCVLVRDHDGAITDFLSYYILPSSRHHDGAAGTAAAVTVRAAYLSMAMPGRLSLQQLVGHAVYLAGAGSPGSPGDSVDVFNAVGVMGVGNGDGAMLQALKFIRGSGSLHYYLFNWRHRGGAIPSGRVGLVLA